MKWQWLIFIGIGLAICAGCYFWWFSPLWILIGGILSITAIIEFIVALSKDGTGDDSFYVGCLVVFWLSVILLAVAFFMDDDYYISQFGGKRHIYEDCKCISNERCEKVSKLSTCIWGCFDECEFCIERKKKDDEIKKKQKEEEIKKKEITKKSKDLEFVNKQIDELLMVRQAILNGEKIDPYDYEFCYEVADEIAEQAIEDYKDAAAESIFN